VDHFPTGDLDQFPTGASTRSRERRAIQRQSAAIEI
jgi:hypothetical protein